MSEAAAAEWPALPPAPEPPEPPVPQLDSLLIGDWARDLVMTAAASTPRSQQAELGPSEIGQVCRRRLAYRIAGTPSVNHPDPLKALIGTDFHEGMARSIKRIDQAHRYLVEHPVTYRGIFGTVDLYDTWRHRLVDWKTSETKRIRRYAMQDDIPVNYRVQTAIYAEGLRSVGYPVAHVALVFLPRDGDLTDIWVWTAEPDQVLADEYVQRYIDLKEQLATGNSPATISATPGPLCAYCPNYSPGSTDLSTACPGKDAKS
jgi:hypothetical protein